MAGFFSFSRRDRNGLLLFLVIIFLGMFFTQAFIHPPVHDNQQLFGDFHDSTVAYVAQIEREEMRKPAMVSELRIVPVVNAVIPSPPQRKFQVVELNTADSAALIQLPGIGPVFSSRIIKFRMALGGFFSPMQLAEVYGFDSSRLTALLPLLVVDTTAVIRLNINQAEFKTILHHPYFSYEMTKSVCNARRKSLYVDFADFVTRAGIPDTLAEKIKPYVSFLK
ncbi:MAG: helix-hairpin-helix domain-containing protein [Bacteroidales bacterium]|nr:helix-hairpin-helix domain-containing protein [Bacteroidales bacterium]MDY0284653.1 helix-hairpin-helix domain-containing protein [Bacteroidales bacterium]HPE87442.1 helix-hairpin-helix domain-containing protein [Bacteroidales bacterium]